MKNIFSNKVVSFDTKNHITAIFNPSFQTIAGKTFVIGTIPQGATTNEWAKDKQCSLSWEHIENYIVFDSAEEYLCAMLQAEQKDER